jgi:hypothetical protein
MVSEGGNNPNPDRPVDGKSEELWGPPPAAVALESPSIRGGIPYSLHTRSSCAITFSVAESEAHQAAWEGLEHVPEHLRKGKALEVLARLRTQREAVERWVAIWVVEAREYGSTWAETGCALGVTAQAVSKRYGRRDLDLDE